MKLALVGTHGVGKTTSPTKLVQSALKKADYNVELVTEVARRSPFPVNEGTTLEGQLWIYRTRKLPPNWKLLDARRTLSAIALVLDNYGYLVNRSLGASSILEAWLSYSGWTRIRCSWPFLQWPTEFRPDGFRSENLEFQERIHELFSELLEEAPFQKISGPCAVA